MGTKLAWGASVVHSTWHHFFDINLIGDNAANRPEFVDPRAALWRKGFNASVEGQHILAQIDQYYKNTVLWLSPKFRRYKGFHAIVAQVATTHHIREVLDGGGSPSIREIGAYAWEYALRLVPPCTMMELSLAPVFERLPIPLLPWDEPTPGPDDAPMPHWPLPPRDLAQAALGGALLAFSNVESLDELHPEQGCERLTAGALNGVRDLIQCELRFTKSALDQLEQGNELLNPTKGR